MSLSIGELVGYVDLDTSGIDKGLSWVEDKLGSAKGKWGMLLGGAGVAAGAAFATSLVGAMNMEPSRDRVAAALDLTKDQAARAGKVSGALFAQNWGESTQEVDSAVEAVMSSIKGMRNASTADLQATTKAALVFSTAMGVDVGRAAQVAGNMIHSGLAKNGTEAFDLLTKASSKVPAELRADILDATDEYGQFFNQLGIQGPQAMAMLAKGAQKGMYGIDKAGDAVKEFTIRATDMSTSSKQAYKAIGLDARSMADDILAGGDRARSATDKVVQGLLNIKNPAKRANMSIALFGTPLEDLSTKQIPSFLRSLQSSNRGLGKWQGATERAGKTLNDNAKGNLAQFKRSLQMAFVNTLGGKVLPAVTHLTGQLNTALGPALQLAGKALQQVTKWMSDHGTIVGIIAGLLVSLLVPGWILAGIAATRSGIAQVRAWVMQQAAAIKTVAVFVATKAAMVAGWVLMGTQAMLQAARMAAAWLIAMGPVGIVIGIVIGLVALIITHWDLVKSITAKVWHAITSAVGAAWGAIKAAVSAGVQFVAAVIRTYVAIWKAVLSAVWKAIKAAAQAVWKAITAVVRREVAGILAVIGGVRVIVGKVRSFFGQAKDAAASKLQALVSYVRGIPRKILSALGNMGRLLYNAGKSILQGLIDGITNKIGELKSKLSGITKLIPLHKGPLVVDAKLLTPNGQAIMQSLMAGIDHEVPALQRTLGHITKAIPQMAKAPQVTRVERTVVERSNGPLVGQVVQAPGEDSNVLAERLWFLNRSRG